MKVYDALADALVAERVELLFTLIDDTVLSLVQALSERDLHIVSARHEQAVIGMADGFARSRRAMAVCAVGAGPALAQTATSLVTARRHRSPLLVLAGEVSGTLTHHVKAFDQAAFVAATGCACYRLEAPAQLGATLLRAISHLNEHGGPVVLCLPADRLEADLPQGWRHAPTHTPRNPVTPPAGEVERAAALIRGAARPLLLAGAGALAAGAREDILALAERSGALLATTLQARGWFSGHRADVGLMGSLASARGRALIGQADLLVAIGTSLNPYIQGTAYGSALIADGAQLIQIDTDRARIGHYRAVDLTLHGDARAAVKAIAGHFDETGAHGTRAWQSDRELAQPAPQPGSTAHSPVPMNALLAALDRLLPANRSVVVDCGLFAFPVVDHIHCSPEFFIWSADFGSVGMALAMAVGAALALPERTCCVFVGDGGFTMAPQEIMSAVAHGVRLVVVILDDGAYGAEAYLLQARQKDTRLASLHNPDLAAMAAAMGARAVTVRCLDDLHEVARLIEDEHGGPLVVHARTERIAQHRAIP